MQFLRPLALGLGLSLMGSLSLVCPSVQAQPDLFSRQISSLEFETPTFQREPLPQALNTAEAWQRVANNAFIAQDYHNSLVAYDKAVELSKAQHRAELLEERGWVHYLSGHLEQAGQDLQQAALLYRDQEDRSAYRNVQQIRQFIEIQAGQLDSLS